MTDRDDIRTALLAELKRPRTTVAVGSFLAVAAIMANALLLQSPHPSPLVSTRGAAAEERLIHIGDPLVRSIQDALKQAGYYSGPLDGFDGPNTRSAILAFEAKAGHDQTGKPSAALLADIRTFIANILAAPAASPPPAGVAMSVAVDPHVAAVQKALALSAYGPLGTDGVFGPETRAAIMRFQRDHNLPESGELSDSLLIELRAIGALADE